MKAAGRPGGLRVLILLFALILAACGTPSLATPEAAAQQDLTVAEGPDFQQTEPPVEANVGLGPSVRVLEGLVRMGPDYHLEPLLAASWEFRPSKTWRFHLRRGVRFHDGTPFTAAAVKWSVERWMRTGRVNYLALGPGAKVSIVDDYTVDIETVVPNRRLVESLADQRRAIVASGTYPGAGTRRENTPIGTGPFRFVHYFPGTELVLGHFSEYWGGAPRLSRLTVRYFSDAEARYAALRNHTVDLAVDIAPQQAAELVNAAGLRLLRSQVAGADLLFFNLQRPAQHPVVQEVAVRRAVALAIDESHIADHAWRGFGADAGGLIPQAVLGNARVTPVGHDLAQAKAILDAAGWRVGPDGIRLRDGLRLRLQISLGDLSERTLTSELLRDELRAAGVEAQITLPDVNRFFDHDLGQADYDLAGLGFIGQRDANPLGILSYLSPAPGGCAFCIFANIGPDFDARYAQAVAASDQDARLDAARLTHAALADQAVVIVLAAKPRLIGLSQRVQDFVAQPRDQRYDTAWLAA